MRKYIYMKTINLAQLVKSDGKYEEAISLENEVKRGAGNVTKV